MSRWHGRRFTPEQIQSMTELYRSGKTLDEVAEAFGTYRQLARYYCLKGGAEMRPTFGRHETYTPPRNLPRTCPTPLPRFSR